MTEAEASSNQMLKRIQQDVLDNLFSKILYLFLNPFLKKDIYSL